MKILLLGSGGREHALAWKLKQSPLAGSLFIAPGNPGTARCGTNIAIPLHDFEKLGQFCTREGIELLVVGPEEPLVNGIYDYFKANPELSSIRFIGPSKIGAQLEGSKAFAKEFMLRHQIPTAAYREFTLSNYEEGIQYLKQHPLPIVIKADGLAAGKGVVICQHHDEALAEFEQMIQAAKFGDASKKVVIEEFLTGVELSVFALTDGKNYCILPEAKDYKRIGEGDTGLNTGGMGAISPVPFATADFMQKVEEKVIKPTIRGLEAEKINYTGFVFFGLINVKGEPFVIEYNCRMGDPETEVVMPRLENDMVELLTAAADGQLPGIKIETSPLAGATIVAVSKGYPQEYEKGFAITGINEDYGTNRLVFHAGTRQNENEIVTGGGRVLCVTALENDLDTALAAARQVLGKISFEGMYYRPDIGYEFVKH